VKRLIFVTLIFFCDSVLSAQYEVTTTIKSLFMGPHYNNKVFIEVESRPTTERPEGCTDNASFDFVIDLSTEYGKAYYSAALAAYASNSTVRLESYDSCTVYSSVPGVKTIWLK